MAGKILTKAEAYAKKKSMIVKYDLFPGFLCHPVGRIERKKGRKTRYELENTGMFFGEGGVLKVMSRKKGELINDLIEKARASRSDMIDNLTKGMIATLENNIQDILNTEA